MTSPTHDYWQIQDAKQRFYSIATAGDESVAITVERLDDGEVSPYLTEELRPGDRLEVRGRSATGLRGARRMAGRCC